MVEEAASAISKALNNLGFVEVVSVSFKSDQVGFLCRAHDEGQILKIIQYLLSKEDDWQSHVCKKYFMTDESMKFGWNLSFRADDIESAAKKISGLLVGYKKMFTPAGEDDYAVRMSDTRDRNVPDKGKGATAITAR